jgi:hypothetical protein
MYTLVLRNNICDRSQETRTNSLKLNYWERNLFCFIFWIVIYLDMKITSCLSIIEKIHSDFSILTYLLIQPLCRHFGFLAVTAVWVSSAKPDSIFWERIEETLFRLLIWTTLQIFSHQHLRKCKYGRWCRLLNEMSSAQVWGWMS